MGSVYDQLAVYYDLVHAEVTEDIPFYLALARERGGPILELGCGSGRTLVPLVEAGFEAVGLDHSPAMLARARERLRGAAPGSRYDLVLGEMADFDLGRRFPLVTVPFHTWMHLTDRPAQLAALGCVARHLAPAGWLVIDLPAPATIVEVEHDGTLTLERLLTDPETGERVVQLASTRLDEEHQLLHVTWLYDRVAADGTVRRTVAPMALHYLYPHQAELLLQEAGLKLSALWGDYDRRQFSAAADKLILVAEGPG